MKPTSVDLRQRILDARRIDGQSMGQIALRFKIPKGTVQNIIEHYRDCRTLVPKPQNAGRKPAFAGPALKALESDIVLHPDCTLAELRERSGVKASLVAVHHAVKNLGFTRKKKRYVRSSSNDPKSLPGARPGEDQSQRQTRENSITSMKRVRKRT